MAYGKQGKHCGQLEVPPRHYHEGYEDIAKDGGKGSCAHHKK